MTPIAQAGAALAVALVTGAATLSVMQAPVPDLAVPDGPWQPGDQLDGRSFRTSDRILETGEILKDELRFENGRFRSEMCQAYCDFGWSEYQTWVDGDTIRFTATTICPDAPHTVVWYGTVTGDTVRFDGTWTTRRWYWTRQFSVTGEGAAAPGGAAPSG